MAYDFQQLFNSASAIKLNGGIFSKVIHALIVLLVCVTTLVCIAGQMVICGIVIGAMILLFLVVFLCLMWYAIKYPLFAALDGAQIIQYAQLTIQAKNNADSTNTNLEEGEMFNRLKTVGKLTDEENNNGQR